MLVKMGKTGSQNISELRDVFLRGTNQPEVNQLDQGETQRVPPHRRKQINLTMVVSNLELVA